jgi:NAD(P)-dependent dehydrogenase (short-subunit alcohol dehydrogenase family)
VQPFFDQLFSLAGRTALVTGGSSGIGRAMAEALGRAGAGLVLVARGEPALAEAVARLRSAGCRARYTVADLGRRADIDRVAEAAGEVDILVNAAAMNLRPPLGELTEADWALTMAVNLTAPYLLGQLFGPAMARRGWGRIINIASQQAVRAFGNSGGYGVSKAGITGLTRSQAEAWSPYGVCCNAIAPGFVATPLTRPVAEDPVASAALAARTFVGRNGEVGDFHGVTVFLAGPGSAYVTGQTIFVDGGFSTH